MAAEQSKAAKRRFADGAFHLRYFAGHGLDVGGKPDPLGKYVRAFARMLSCRTWDLEDGDAQFLRGIPDASLDFVHSSHCLEHLHDPREALLNWVRVVKPGGHVVVTVPDEDLYEQGVWPSRFNSDHKWTFTMHKTASWPPKSVNLLALLAGLSPHATVERTRRWRPSGTTRRRRRWPSVPSSSCYARGSVPGRPARTFSTARRRTASGERR